MTAPTPEPDLQPTAAYPCPVCLTETTLGQPCPGCGRAPDMHAATVLTLDGQIAQLRAQVEQAERAYRDLAEQLAQVRRDREHHATQVREAVARETVTQAPTQPPAQVPVQRPGPARPVATSEASPRTVQNLLFILGGLLLGSAAIVFTAVAWSVYGVTGRAVILAVVTLLTLAVPPVGRWRRLTATAETFAALGLLLVLLDGYAAWYVNLGGIADSWNGSFYAGTVCALTAALAFGYGRALRLRAPLLAGLLVAQPVLPLLFKESAPSASGWALIFAGVALADILVVLRASRTRSLAVAGWVAYGAALLIAAGFAAFAWLASGRVVSSLAVLAVALVFAAGAYTSRYSGFHRLAGGVLGLAVAAALARPLAVQWADYWLLITAGPTAAVACVAWLLARIWPVSWTRGGQIGAAVALGVPGLAALAQTLVVAGGSVAAAAPWWHAQPLTAAGYAWQLPVTIVLLTAAAALLLQGWWREAVLVAGVVMLGLAVPGDPGFHLWAASAVDLVLAGLMLGWAWRRGWHAALSKQASAGAALLLVHGLLAGQGSPVQGTVVLTVTVLIALGVAAMARPRAAQPDQRHAAWIGGIAVALADVLLPLLAYSAVVAFGGTLHAAWRTLLIFVFAQAVIGAGRFYRRYHEVALLIIALYPLWPVLPAGESPAIYAAVGASALAVTRSWTRYAAVLPALAALLHALPDWLLVLGERTPEVTVSRAIAVTMLAVAVGLGLRKVAVTAAVTVLPALMWLAIFGVPWPGGIVLTMIVAGALLAAGNVTPPAGLALVRESRAALEVCAHVLAGVALLLCHGELRASAGVLALWGVAIGLTALRGRDPVLRAGFAAGLEIVAWWLLLASADVSTLEAYTLPAALLALVAGIYGTLRQPGLSSWIGYGPALAAALLPSLAVVLNEPEQIWRRLLLGTGALAIVVAGAVWRRQAPVLLGGATLLAVALHELSLVWQLVHTWVPLAIGGALLVAMAIMYERLLRDAKRLTRAISEMK